LVEPLRNHTLSEILRSWKSFTSNEINKACGNTGAFWRKEYFDHLVRSEAALNKFRDYIQAHKDYKPFIHYSLRQDDGDTFLRLPAGEK
jgi:hypothetical protein